MDYQFGGDGGESNPPSKQWTKPICYRRIRRFGDAPQSLTGEVSRSLPAVSRERLAGGQRFQSLIVLCPWPAHQAEAGRTRLSRVLSGESELWLRFGSYGLPVF